MINKNQKSYLSVSGLPTARNLMGIFLLVMVVLAIDSCVSYRRVELSSDEALANARLQDSYSGYDVYVNDGDHTYRVNHPDISETGISGELERMDPKEEEEVLAGAKLKKNSEHIYDLLFYSNKKLSDSIDQTAGKDFRASQDSLLGQQDIVTARKGNFSLSSGDINNISVYSVDENSVGLLALYVVLGIIVAGLLVWGMAALSGYGINQSTTSSGNSSGNSSGSNSGGSNSGGSNSGGGGGSCYVATMVYGDYNAPEVMVLRNFRDGFLEKYYLGRRFIAFYYHYSPKFVARFNKYATVHRVIRFFLNGLVRWLSRKY